MGVWSKQPWSRINECSEERMAAEPVSGEGRRGSAGEKVVAALGDRTAQGREAGDKGGCKRGKELGQEGRVQEGYQESPDKDCLTEGKGNG